MSSAVIGKPVARVDGRAKVTGEAKYAAEFEIGNLAYLGIVISTIPSGRIAEIDTAAAEGAPGVVAVLTHRNAPKLPYRSNKTEVDPEKGERLHMLQDDRIHHNGQYIAAVVAEREEQAWYAASLVRVRYEEERAVTAFDEAFQAPIVPEAKKQEQGSKAPGEQQRGAPEPALAAAEVSIDQEYVIARENHNPIEAHATIAWWDGEQLVLWDKTQWVDNVREEITAQFGLKSRIASALGVGKDQVRVISPFVGGAFGSALRVWPHVTLAAMAAQVAGRPVKIVVPRRLMYYATGDRPYTKQRVGLGASREGKLTAIVHEGTAESSTYEQYTENLLDGTPMLYSCPNVLTRYKLAPLNVHTPTPMRAPGMCSGQFALECAIDELAYKLKIDPVEFRIRNEPECDEGQDLPFSSRSLVQCYRTAAERFGWSKRNATPGSMRDGRLQIGHGMAAAAWEAMRDKATARVRLRADGMAVVQSAASDMGPGTYTAMTQIAAETLGMPMDRVRFELGDTDLPEAPVHGGSMTLASVGTAVQEACAEARRQALALARGDGNSPLYRVKDEEALFENGRIARKDDPTRGERYEEILSRHGKDVIEVTLESKPGNESKKFSIHSFGAVFAEVQVDPDLCEVRVRRLVGAYGCGRIVNPRTSRSQIIGGMVMGIGMALMEKTEVDQRTGRVPNANLAEYLVPVHADIRELEAIFVDEIDPQISALGAKGLAEIGVVGVAPAIANAVFHATGKRIRELPITPDKLL